MPIFKLEMPLSRYEGISPAGFLDFYIRCDPWRIGTANEIRVEAFLLSDISGSRAAITEMDGDGLIGVPGEYEYGSLKGSAVLSNFDNIVVAHSKVRCGRRTQYCRVVPDE